MTPQDFRAELERLGISQAEFARLANADDRSVRRWADARVNTPLAPGAVARIEAAFRAHREKRKPRKISLEVDPAKIID